MAGLNPARNPHQKRNDKQNQENEEQDLGYARGGEGHSPKTQNCRHYCNNQKYYRPVEHRDLRLSMCTFGYIP
jgi:hypothetical protein